MGTAAPAGAQLRVKYGVEKSNHEARFQDAEKLPTASNDYAAEVGPRLPVHKLDYEGRPAAHAVGINFERLDGTDP